MFVFVARWAGRDHTDAVGLHVVCIRANGGNGNMSIVTRKERDGTNNEREPNRSNEEEEGRRRKEGQLVPGSVLVKDD